ncbi:hypothetical protein V2J09_000991 [Rumex salicifolius]
MGSSSSHFTWSCGTFESTKVWMRLDRMFTNLAGRVRWVESLVKNLPAIRSDHISLCFSLAFPLRGGVGAPSWLPQFYLEKWKGIDEVAATLNNLHEELL